MGYLGLEPRTYRLKAEYSTIELVTQILSQISNKKASICTCLKNQFIISIYINQFYLFFQLSIKIYFYFVFSFNSLL